MIWSCSGAVRKAVPKTGADRAEGRNAAYDLRFVAPGLYDTVKINIGAVYCRIAQGQAGYVLSCF